jgi:hypothetical protein
MTASVVLTLIVSIVIVAALTAVCRLGYLLAGGWLDERDATAEASLLLNIEHRAA